MIIKPKISFFNFNFKELIQYKDLIYYFVKRDFVSYYKQTILGPLWYVVQPISTSFIYYIIFTKIAKLDTGAISPFLFYLSGNIIWLYFSENLMKTSDTFLANSSIFGKVYFPRLIVPISTSISGLISSCIQLILFLFFYGYEIINKNEIININKIIFIFPLFIYLIIQSLSWGILISSLTIKFRDLKFLLKFGLQLWMFASPVVYSISNVPEKYLQFYYLNPIVLSIEVFRWIFFNQNNFSLNHVLINFFQTFFIFLISLLLFNKVEKTFMDHI